MIKLSFPNFWYQFIQVYLGLSEWKVQGTVKILFSLETQKCPDRFVMPVFFFSSSVSSQCCTCVYAHITLFSRWGFSTTTTSLPSIKLMQTACYSVDCKSIESFLGLVAIPCSFAWCTLLSIAWPTRSIAVAHSDIRGLFLVEFRVTFCMSFYRLLCRLTYALSLNFLAMIHLDGHVTNINSVEQTSFTVVSCCSFQVMFYFAGLLFTALFCFAWFCAAVKNKVAKRGTNG